MKKMPFVLATLATLGFSAAGVSASASSMPANARSPVVSSASPAAATGVIVAEDSDQSADSDKSDSGANQPAQQQDDQK